MKVALYARVSSELQEEKNTIESQIEVLEAYAKNKGYTIIDKYIDNGYSGTLLARPALDKLRDDASKQLFEGIIIHSPDRLARKYVYQEIVIEELKNKNVEVIFYNRPISETAEDQLLLGVQGIIAEYERAKFLERTRRGRLHRARSGHILGNLPPYGYDCVTKSQSETGFAYYKINEGEANIVKVMFNLLINGNSTYKIVTELNRLGYKARKGKRWAKSSVAKILRNSTYTGITYYNKHLGVPSLKSQEGQKIYHRRKNNTFKLRPKEDWIAISGIPQIIEKSIFDKAQDQLTKNSLYSPRNQKINYLLKGLLKCGLDHRSFYGVPMHGRPFYRCSGKSKLISDVSCPAPSISANIIEPIVWNAIEELLNNRKLVLEQYKRYQNNKLTYKTKLPEKIKKLESKVVNLLQQETRLLEIYSQGVISSDQLKLQLERLKEAKNVTELELNANRKDLSSNLNTKLSIQNVDKLLINFKKTLQNIEPVKKQSLLRNILKEVEVKDYRIILRGFLPQNVDLRPQHTDDVDANDTISFEIIKKLPKGINQYKYVYA